MDKQKKRQNNKGSTHETNVIRNKNYQFFSFPLRLRLGELKIDVRAMLLPM